MAIRLPKPRHGWRAFAGEVGIIVLGVLIALGCQQVIDALHWRAETRAARAALLSEAADNVTSAQFRQTLNPCVEKRLSEINQIFHDHAAGKLTQLLGPISRPLPLGAPRSTWELAVSSDALSHMNLAEKLRYSDAFGNYEYWDKIQNREQDTWLVLSMLDEPEVLTESDWSALHQAYSQARAIQSRIQIIAPLITTTNNLGQRATAVALPPRARDTLKQFCSPVLARSSHDARL